MWPCAAWPVGDILGFVLVVQHVIFILDSEIVCFGTKRQPTHSRKLTLYFSGYCSRRREQGCSGPQGSLRHHQRVSICASAAVPPDAEHNICRKELYHNLPTAHRVHVFIHQIWQIGTGLNIWEKDTLLVVSLTTFLSPFSVCVWGGDLRSVPT